MESLTIRKAVADENDVINDVVNIHLATFEGFFLTFMGRGFLKQMYKAYIKHDKSDLLIAQSCGKTVGFLAYSEHMSGLYKYMIKHYLIQFAWYSFCAFLRKPKIFMRLLRAFLKPGESRREEEYIELASIGVSPVAKSMGVGSSLVDNLKKLVDFEKFEYITLETDAVDNEIANKFYIKNGFVIVREYETHEGRRMYEYRYRGGLDVERAEDSLHTEYSKEG